MIPCDKTCLEKYLLLEPLFRIHNVRNILRILRILQRGGKRIIKKHNYFCYLDYVYVLSFRAMGHSLFASLKIW